METLDKSQLFEQTISVDWAFVRGALPKESGTVFFTPRNTTRCTPKWPIFPWAILGFVTRASVTAFFGPFWGGIVWLRYQYFHCNYSRKTILRSQTIETVLKRASEKLEKIETFIICCRHMSKTDFRNCHENNPFQKTHSLSFVRGQFLFCIFFRMEPKVAADQLSRCNHCCSCL